MLQGKDALQNANKQSVCASVPSKWYLLALSCLGRPFGRINKVRSSKSRCSRKGALNKDEEDKRILVCPSFGWFRRFKASMSMCSANSRARSPSERSQADLVEVAFQAAVECCSSRKLTIEVARCRRWCPQTQVPKLLVGTLIAISSGPTTPPLVLDKLLA
jgi:hypothetical protein